MSGYECARPGRIALGVAEEEWSFTYEWVRAGREGLPDDGGRSQPMMASHGTPCQSSGNDDEYARELVREACEKERHR